MSDQPLEPWIVATQTSLGAVIQAPKLTDKLLRKPPFRFLHDIVTNFIKAANFPVGLYSDDMLDSSKCTEKEQKLEFLTQLVKVVELATGKSTAAKPAKIIAGAEPEGTNDLLQLLASCASLSPKDKERAVKKALGGGGSDSITAAAAPPPPIPQQQQQQPVAAAAPPPPQQPQPQATAEEPPKQHRSSSSKHKAEASAAAAAGGAPSSSSTSAGQAAPETTTPPQSAQARLGGLQQPVPVAAQQQASSAGDRPGTATARKAPPKTASNEIVENRAEPVQPVAGVIVESKRGAKSQDPEEESKDQDWMRLVEEHESTANRGGAGAAGGGGGAANVDEAKGYLAQQALKAKKEQEEAARKAAEEAARSGAGGDGADGSGGIVLNVHKRDKTGSAMGDGELSKLREQLQLLTKASNPLSKFLEAIHDDMDTMSRELEMWRGEARTQAAAAKDAQRETETALHEVTVQLQGLEDAIGDQITKTNMVRARILQNEKTIETMVRMVAVNPEASGPAPVTKAATVSSSSSGAAAKR